MKQYIRSSNSGRSSIIKKFISSCNEKMEIEYGYDLVGKASGDFVKFDVYDGEKSPENLVSSLKVDMNNLELDELESDRAWFENSVYDIVEDLVNDNYGEITRGPKF